MRPQPRRPDPARPSARPSDRGLARLRLLQLEDRLNPAPSVLQTFDTITADESANLNLFYSAPSDPAGAVGPGHIVVATNSSIGWYTKTGVAQAELPLTSGNPTPEFWPSLNPDLFDVFDPKVVYDQFAQRFVMIALESDTFSNSRILIAVSQTSDPNGGWWFQSVDTLTNIGGEDHWFDFPGLAVDENAIYITGNMFGTFTGNYPGPRLVVMDKGLYNGDNGSTSRMFDPLAGTGLSPRTIQPAGLDGARPAGTTGTYLVAYESNTGLGGFGNDEARIIRMDNPLSVTPTFTVTRVSLGNVDTATFSMPDPPQAGSAFPLNANDNDMLSVVWRNNTLSFVNMVNPPTGPDKGQATVHWMQVSTAGTPVLVTQGNIGGEEIGPGTATLYPSLAVDRAGRLGIGYGASSKALFPSSYFSVVTPANGTVTAPMLTKAGTFQTTDSRWGDYSSTGLDPVSQTFWQFNQYSAPSTVFGDGWINFAAEIDPGTTPGYAVGADAGGGPTVQVYGYNGTFQYGFYAYAASFTGGVRIALADVNGDQVPDIITAPGAGGGPNVRVFDGTNPQRMLYSFFAYDPGFTNGLYVAAGDVDADGAIDIITGAGEAGGPHVRVFRLEANRRVSTLASFFAYAPGFTGGVRVAVADYNNDGAVDIITSPGFGGGPHVQVFDGRDIAAGRATVLRSFMAGDPNGRGGAFVTIGNMNGDGVGDFIVGSGANNREVQVFDGRTLTFMAGFNVFQPGQSASRVIQSSSAAVGDLINVGVPNQLLPNATQTPQASAALAGGQRVAVADIDNDGVDDILAIGGPGDRSVLRFRNGRTMATLRADQAIFNASFLGGAFVATFR